MESRKVTSLERKGCVEGFTWAHRGGGAVSIRAVVTADVHRLALRLVEF